MHTGEPVAHSFTCSRCPFGSILKTEIRSLSLVSNQDIRTGRIDCKVSWGLSSTGVPVYKC